MTWTPVKRDTAPRCAPRQAANGQNAARAVRDHRPIAADVAVGLEGQGGARPRLRGGAARAARGRSRTRSRRSRAAPARRRRIDRTWRGPPPLPRRSGLVGIAHAKAETAARPHRPLHGFGRWWVFTTTSRMPWRASSLEGVVQQRPVQDGQGGLGQEAGEGPHPRAQAGREHHRLHSRKTMSPWPPAAKKRVDVGVGDVVGRTEAQSRRHPVDPFRRLLRSRESRRWASRPPRPPGRGGTRSRDTSGIGNAAEAETLEHEAAAPPGPPPRSRSRRAS